MNLDIKYNIKKNSKNDLTSILNSYSKYLSNHFYYLLVF